MANIQPSPPFSLAPHDWKSLGFGAAFAVVGALCGFATSTAIPALQSHESNQFGVLIVTLLSAFVPWLFNVAKKYFTDTTAVVKLLVMAVGISLCGSAFAGESAATLNIPDLNTILGWFLSKWWGMPLLMFGVPLILTKVWPKINLYAMFGPLLVKAITWALTPAPITPVLMAIQPTSPAGEAIPAADQPK